MLEPVDVGAIGSALGITCGIVAVICSTVTKIRKNKEESRIRQSIIDNHIDPDTAKLLVRNKKPLKNIFITLRWGLILLFGGIGYFLGISITSDSFAWVLSGIGVGIALLISFLVEYKLTRKQFKKSEDTI
ncbi:MAG: hypothetical protein PUH21_07125 [Prevotellaceae bacterium]|nr:hypothetical protein [Prevotellaceae bacterium]MDY3856098.1 hypothetical protein [Bacteroidaceae bacterium]